MEHSGFSLLIVPRGNEGRGVREFKLSASSILLTASAVLVAAVLFVAMATTYGSSLVDRVEYARLQRENQILRTQLDEMDRTVTTLSDQMRIISQRDDAMRMMAEMEPLADDIRRAGVGGRMDFDSRVLLLSSGTGGRVKDVQTRLNQLHREAQLELESLLEIGTRLEESEAFLRGYPSIIPIDNTRYRTRMNSAFGWRDDPLYGTRKFHWGHDWAAAKGTPVRATADGRIKVAKSEASGPSRYGFGNYIEIDHGNGYTTFYGHLDHLHARARAGAAVKRGDVIGFVGNTGRSTGYHLHYQIEFNGKEMNPWYYYYDERLADVFGR